MGPKSTTWEMRASWRGSASWMSWYTAARVGRWWVGQWWWLTRRGGWMAISSAHSCVNGWWCSWLWRWEGWQARPAVAVRTVAGPCLLEQGAAAQGAAPPEKLSTAVKVRWMGEAVPGRVVNSRRQRPSSNGLAVGACGRRRDQLGRDASNVAQEALHQQHRVATSSRALHAGIENKHAAAVL